MLKLMVKQLNTAFRLIILMTLVTGLLYPGLMTGFAQLFFPWKANGSLIANAEAIIGSQLIGQHFTQPGYFWGRPSATEPYPYNAAASKGSNLSPDDPMFLSLIETRISHLKPYVSTQFAAIPADLIYASGSGLDPEISVLAALFQVSRVAKARNIDESKIKTLVLNHVIPRTFGILGEPRVNVLLLNLALDRSTHAN